MSRGEMLLMCGVLEAKNAVRTVAQGFSKSTAQYGLAHASLPHEANVHAHSMIAQELREQSLLHGGQPWHLPVFRGPLTAGASSSAVPLPRLEHEPCRAVLQSDQDRLKTAEQENKLCLQNQQN